MKSRTQQPGESPADEWFTKEVRADEPGASIIMLRDGKVIYERAHGLADVENQIPITFETNFRLASVTKQFTAMAVMLLAENKSLHFENPIAKYFSECPACWSTLTIRQLLNHTSGLKDYENLIPKGTRIPLRDRDVLWLLRQQEQTYFTPGSRFRYSNTGFAILAMLVERVSGRTFATYLRENIFQPLGMTQTVAYEAGISTVPIRACGYTRRKNHFVKTDQSLTSSVLGDGGIYSSTRDLAKWAIALDAEKLISGKIARECLTPGLNTRHNRQWHYGFGWFLSGHRGLQNAWHSGNTIGFSTWITRFPGKQLTAIILTNRNEAGLSPLARKIAEFHLSRRARLAQNW